MINAFEFAIDISPIPRGSFAITVVGAARRGVSQLSPRCRSPWRGRLRIEAAKRGKKKSARISPVSFPPLSLPPPPFRPAIAK